MLTVFLCDNATEDREKYARLIEESAHKHRIEIALHIFTDSKQLLFNTIDLPDLPDIIYINPQLPGLNGIDAARYLRAHGTYAAIIFLADTGGQVFEAFDVEPVNYLIKARTTPQKFEQVFLKAAHEVAGRGADYFACETGGSRRVIPLRDICYFEIYKRIITVHVAVGEPCDFYGSMEQLEKQLSGRNFIRIHRSYLVGIAYITLLEHQQITLNDGTQLPVGVTYAKSVREKLLFHTESIYRPRQTG